MSEQHATPLSTRAKRVLVVDDNDDNRNLLWRRLRAKGYEVDLAEDGPSALDACAKTTYDAIILDVMMPGMSGLEVLERLRRRWSKTELSVIMATAQNDSASIVDALKRGANDHVTKPIDFPVLFARLETQLAMNAEAAERATKAAENVDLTFGIAPGTVLCGRYEVLEKRGEGGFAVVYCARQISTNRKVALKHLRPDVLGSSGNKVQLERFELESRLIGELDHPNVVRLIDSGSISVRTVRQADDAAATTRNERQDSASSTRRRPPEAEVLEVPYIVMELLSGEPLSKLIARDAPVAFTRAVDLMLPVLSALSAAHEKGVVHRDVKPSNIMLCPDGRGEIEPKVLDFGVAKLTAREGTDLTVSASLIGTPQYMPPEQARGVKDVDGRADQFSAAAVLYQMLTGQTLYSGDTLLDLVRKVLAADYTPLSNARSDLPAGLVEVVSRALSTAREDRHASIAAFARALLPYASDKAARRWADRFAADPPKTADEGASAGSSIPVVVGSSEPGSDLPVFVSEGSPEHPHAELTKSGAVPVFVSERSPVAQAEATAPTVQLGAPAKKPMAPSTAPIPPTLPSPQNEAATDDEPGAADRDEPVTSPQSSNPSDPSEPAHEPTLVSRSTPPRPGTEMARAPSKKTKPVSWERKALILLAATILLYLLARYLF